MATSKNPLHRIFGVDAPAHGEQKVEAVENVNLEVINLGLSRTGTTSIHAALERLGIGPDLQGVLVSSSQDLYRSPPLRDAFNSLFSDINAGTVGPPEVLAARLRRMTRGYRSAGDGPINGLVKECIIAYPKAKYILSLRDDGKDSWWRSFDAAVGLHFRRDWSRTIFRTLIFPVGFIRRQDDVTQQIRQKAQNDFGEIGPNYYTNHNKMVEELVPREQLLKYSVSEGWEPLCAFLGVPVPDEPFPRINELASMKKIYLGMQAYGAMMWMLMFSAVVGAIYLASSPSRATKLVHGAIAWFGSFKTR